MADADPDDAPAAGSPVLKPRALTWEWSAAALGAAYAIPAAIAVGADVTQGVAFAVGVLPAAIVGLQPVRRARRSTAVLGTVVGVPIVVGSILANIPVLAVLALFGAANGAVYLARRWPMGQIAVVLGLPMMALGFSYTDVGESLGLAALMIAGSIYACLVSLLWPEHPPPATPRAKPPIPSVSYGIRLGAAGAVAATIGFALDLDHVGWASAAALLVMRPSAEMQQIRSVGRLVSVASGAALAVVFVDAQPAVLAYRLAVVVAVAAAAATHRSRWYVTSAFTTFLVFVMLLYGNAGDATSRFNERLVETALGVALAYVFGLAIPKVLARHGQDGPAANGSSTAL